MFNVRYQDILKAQKNLKDKVTKTPLIYSDQLSKESKSNVWFKMENLQNTGSFKVRGALNKLDSLKEEDLKKGVVAASSGNHGRGLAYGCSLKNINSHIVVPASTSETKKTSILKMGADLIEYNGDFNEAEQYARTLAEKNGQYFINAFEDDYLMAGQGTAVLEAIHDEPDFDAIIVPTGGGGLLCGAAIVAKAINPSIKVIGVQTTASPHMYYSFRNGASTHVEYKDTYAEGLHGGLSQKNLDISLNMVDDIVLVEEESIAKSVYWMANHHHYMIEGSGAVGMAAFFDGQLSSLKNKKVLVVITGGNIDVGQFKDFMIKYHN